MQIENELKLRQMEKVVGTSQEKKRSQIAKRKFLQLNDYYHILN